MLTGLVVGKNRTIDREAKLERDIVACYRGGQQVIAVW